MSSKTKLGLFIVVIAIAAIITGLVTSPNTVMDDENATRGNSTTPTSSEQVQIPSEWNEYSNSQLNVTASYPPSASVQTEGPEQRHIKFTYLGEDNATGEITDGFTLTISNYNKNESTSLREFVTSQINDNVPARPTSDVATTTFRDEVAYQWTQESLGTVNKLATSPTKDRAVIISYNISDPNNNDYDTLVDQIIASAKFNEIDEGNAEPAGTVSEVTLMMLDRNVPEGEDPERGCDLLAPITRDIKPTQAPLTAAMEELFSISRTNVQGFYNFLANTNDTLSFDRAAVTNGTANIYLTGELSNLAGVCDNPRSAIQIEETAKQFSTVEDVQIYLNGEPTNLTPSGR